MLSFLYKKPKQLDVLHNSLRLPRGSIEQLTAVNKTTSIITMYSLSAVPFVVAVAMLCMLSSQVRAEETGLDTQESAVHHRQERGLLNGLLCDVSRLCVRLDVKADANLCCKCNKGTYIKIKNECHRKVASCLLSSLSNTLSGLTPDLPVVDSKHCS